MLFPIGLYDGLALALLLVPLTTWGDDQPENVPSYVLSREERFRPCRRKVYVETTKKWIQAMKSQGLEISFVAFGDWDGNVEYNTSAAGLAEVGSRLRAWAKAEEMLASTEWGQERLSTLAWSKYSLWWQSPALTYRPATPNPNDMPYFVWKNLRVRPDQETRFVATGMRIRALLERRAFDRGIAVFRNVAGSNGPLYTVIVPAQNPSELYDWLQSQRQRLAPELDPLLDELGSFVEEVTEEHGFTLSDISLIKK